MSNKFAEQRKKRSSNNITEEIANRLYEENNEPIVNDDVEIKEKESETIEPVKRGKGRPRKENEKYTILNFRIKDSLKDSIRLAAAAHSLSMGAYLTKLIEDDINENLAAYQQLRDIREKLGV